jgi:long-chain acyl-CoA synthetase
MFDTRKDNFQLSFCNPLFFRSHPLIFDRKKQIFKLSQGEYVAPDSVEEIIRRSDYVAHVFVHGDSLKSCVIGVVVPDQGAITSWAKRRHLPSDSFTALCNMREVKKFIMEDIERLSKDANLAYYEMVNSNKYQPSTKVSGNYKL